MVLQIVAIIVSYCNNYYLLLFSCVVLAPCGPGAIPLIPSLPHFLLYLLVSFSFSLLIHALSIFLLFIPSHSTRIVPLRFHAPWCRRKLQNVTLVLFVLILCLTVFLVKDPRFFVLYLIYFCLVCEVVSPCYRRWCNNLNEPLDPFPYLGGCWIKRRPGLRLIYRWPSYTG